MIPWYSIQRIGKIFVEGLRYGRDNWKKGVHDAEYQEERWEHAMVHLIKYKEGDTTEDHLAKVAWFCVTQMELMRLKQLEPAKVEASDSEEESIISNLPEDCKPICFPLASGVIYRNRDGRDVILTTFGPRMNNLFHETVQGKTVDRIDNGYTFILKGSGVFTHGTPNYTDLIGELKDQKKYNN